eukprot:jgi/Mesen1/7846/ME000419S07150
MSLSSGPLHEALKSRGLRSAQNDSRTIANSTAKSFCHIHSCFTMRNVKRRDMKFSYIRIAELKRSRRWGRQPLDSLGTAHGRTQSRGG